MAAGPSVQRRAILNPRIGVAALLIAVVVITMLITFDDRSNEEPDDVPETPDGEATAPEVTPAPGATVRTVANTAQWQAAVQAAQPGDVIRITANIGARLAYRGSNDGGVAEGADGTAAAPIVITADPGVWIDPGDKNSGFGALDILYVNHVHAVGVRVRNAQFGIRCNQCHGSAGSPVRIANNTVTDIGHAGIHIAGHWNTHAPSDHVLVESNVVNHTGKTAPQYGEGVYIGYGGTEWLDNTSNVTVRNNEISYTGAEGVDVKPGTRDILVENNLIHDLAPIDGGAISAHYVNAIANPHPNQLDQVTVRGNRIWNQNLNGVGGANDWAIWVGHGGVEVRENIVWGLRNNPNATRAVRIRATQVFGPHPIVIADNIFWTARGWVAELTPSGAGNVVASGNQGPDAATNEIVVSADAFPGPVPPLGSGSTADSGAGPGSAFIVAASPPAPTTSTTSPPTTSAPTTVPPTTGAPTTLPPPTTPLPDAAENVAPGGPGDITGSAPLTTVSGHGAGGGTETASDGDGATPGHDGDGSDGAAAATESTTVPEDELPAASSSDTGDEPASPTDRPPAGDLAFDGPNALDFGLDLGETPGAPGSGGAVSPTADADDGSSRQLVFGLVLLTTLVTLASYLGIRAARPATRL